MDRDEAIEYIGNLYPPDSGYADTAAIGRQDMIDAIADQWRELPTPVLVEIAMRQLQRENSG